MTNCGNYKIVWCTYRGRSRMLRRGGVIALPASIPHGRGGGEGVFPVTKEKEEKYNTMYFLNDQVIYFYNEIDSTIILHLKTLRDYD